MGFLDTLEKKFRGFAVPNLTLYLIIMQVVFFAFNLSGTFLIERVVLVPGLVLEGEWWRLFTFLFIPPTMNPIFAFFAWYMFYLMGTALEGHWGDFRYNLFLLCGYLVTVGASFFFPLYAATNVFIGGSVFLAFAFLYPEFQIYIFFILPVKMRWLAILTWFGYGYQMYMGPWSLRLLVLASIANFLLFFGRDILLLMKSGNRQMVAKAKEISSKPEAFHCCTVCGATDQSHPNMEFRYCPECNGLGYCKEHIAHHEHVKKK